MHDEIVISRFTAFKSDGHEPGVDCKGHVPLSPVPSKLAVKGSVSTPAAMAAIVQFDVHAMQAQPSGS